ncbi:type II secretion system protein GspM [Methylothermus subterraneus]
MPLSDGTQRLLALALLLLPALLVYLAVVAPYLSWLRSNQERIADLKFQLGRLSRIAAEEPSLRARLEAARSHQSADRYYLSGETPALASAELQKHLSAIIRTAGGELTSTQVLPHRQEERFTRIAVLVRFTAGTPSLREVLYQIESSRPLLKIESLTIRALPGRLDPKTRSLVPTDRLNVDMEVEGYLVPPA